MNNANQIIGTHDSPFLIINFFNLQFKILIRIIFYQTFKQDMLARISKTLPHISYNRINWTNRQILNRTKFSTNKDINRLKETAEIAQKVIKMIRNPFKLSELEMQAFGNDIQIEKFKSYALAERIKNALMKLNIYSQSRDEVLKLFTTGVLIPPSKIFHQERIQYAKTGRKFVYCPNSIISNQIFSILSQQPPLNFLNQRRFLLKGFKGVSKTVSMSLLWHLTKLINQYRFDKDLNEKQIKQKFNQPIIVYWSLKMLDSQQSVLQGLLSQLPELKKVYTVKQIIQNKIDIAEFYEEKFRIEVYLVVDQINSLAKNYQEIMLQLQS